jgi:hypothetical protein
MWAGPPSYASDLRPVRTTVCELVAHPSKFDDVEVSIRGYVFAGVEVTNISDASCSGAVQLTAPGDFYRHKDIRSFWTGIRRHGMHAMATVIGRFHMKAPVYPFPMPAIDVHSVRQVIYE